MIRKTALFAALLAMANPAHAAPASSPAPGQFLAQTGTEADHAALRAIKETMTTAINKQDFDAARAIIHEPFLATAITQDSFTDFDAMVGFYKSLFTRDLLRLEKVSIAAEADELSQIYTGTFAVTRGTTQERYDLSDGRGYDIKGRWTATSVKEPDGSWKVLAIHAGTSFLDNPVLGAVEKSLMWFAASGGLLGLLAGFFLGRFTARRKAASAA